MTRLPRTRPEYADLVRRLGKYIIGIGLVLTACGSPDPGVTTASSEIVDTTGTPTTSAEIPSLVGRWERAESTFTSLDGMIVEVEADGTTGVIVEMPENPYQFQVGDEKWANIESTDDGEYSFDDLVREENTGATSTVEGVITVQPDGDTLEMTFPTTGTTQEWVRVEG